MMVARGTTDGTAARRRWLRCALPASILIVDLVVMTLAVGEGLDAQTSIYTWTDERGIVHFSNAMVSATRSLQAERLDLPPPTSFAAERLAGANIPLVVLDNDPTRKFVNATLQGQGTRADVLMLVDTGAQISLIDAALADQLDLEHIEEAWLTGVTGSVRGWIGRLAVLQLGRERVYDLRVMVGPTPGPLLLGMDVLDQLQLAVGPRTLLRLY